MAWIPSLSLDVIILSTLLGCKLCTVHRWRKLELTLVDIVFLSAATNWSRVPTQRWLISQCWSCFKLYVIASRTTYVLHVCVRVCVCVCFIFCKIHQLFDPLSKYVIYLCQSEEYKKHVSTDVASSLWIVCWFVCRTRGWRLIRGWYTLSACAATRTASSSTRARCLVAPIRPNDNCWLVLCLISGCATWVTCNLNKPPVKLLKNKCLFYWTSCFC